MYFLFQIWNPYLKCFNKKDELNILISSGDIRVKKINHIGLTDF